MGSAGAKRKLLKHSSTSNSCAEKMGGLVSRDWAHLESGLQDSAWQWSAFCATAENLLSSHSTQKSVSQGWGRCQSLRMTARSSLVTEEPQISYPVEFFLWDSRLPLQKHPSGNSTAPSENNSLLHKLRWRHSDRVYWSTAAPAPGSQLEKCAVASEGTWTVSQPPGQVGFKYPLGPTFLIPWRGLN